MGGLFSIYWLMRLGIDGERGFCFGVQHGSEEWRPHRPPSISAMRTSTASLRDTYDKRGQVERPCITATSLHPCHSPAPCTPAPLHPCTPAPLHPCTLYLYALAW